MSAVHPTQRWGITAGVPEGWSVALKNGFYPTTGTPRWRVGSTGFVRHDASGGGYAITIMTDQNPDHDTGQRLVELVSRHVAGALTDGEPASRPVDRSVCVRTSGGEAWSGVASRLGTSDVTNEAFVDALYPELLHRPADPRGAEHWVAKLDGDAGRIHVAGQFYASLESRRDRVERMYQEILGRAADGGGRDHWARVLSDADDVVLAAFLASSVEFYRAAQR